jgi:hypothetical protein
MVDKPETRSQKPEVRKQKAEGRRNQKPEVRNQKSETRLLNDQAKTRRNVMLWFLLVSGFWFLVSLGQTRNEKES